MPWTYEPDRDRKHKRDWRATHAGFVVGPSGEIIGKCPSNLTETQASALLNEDCAITYSPLGWPHDYPARIYNIHNGVLYRAKPTTPGQSYHGFPEHQERAKELPRAVKERILELARHKNCEAEIKKCLRGKS